MESTRWIDYADARRVELGLSQEQLTARLRDLGCPIHQTRWSKWCQGTGAPSVEQLPYLAAALQLPLEALVYHPGYQGPRGGGEEAAPDPDRDALERVIAAVGGPAPALRILIAALADRRGPSLTDPGPNHGPGARQLNAAAPAPPPGPPSARRGRGRPPKRRPGA